MGSIIGGVQLLKNSREVGCGEESSLPIRSGMWGRFVPFQKRITLSF